jgi:hypothetical protein
MWGHGVLHGSRFLHVRSGQKLVRLRRDRKRSSSPRRSASPGQLGERHGRWRKTAKSRRSPPLLPCHERYSGNRPWHVGGNCHSWRARVPERLATPGHARVVSHGFRGRRRRSALLYCPAVAPFHVSRAGIRRLPRGDRFGRPAGPHRPPHAHRDSSSKRDLDERSPKAVRVRPMY